MEWITLERPGYFGRRRDEKITHYNELFGEGNWRIVWECNGQYYKFATACKWFYEESYYQYFLKHPEEVEAVCQYIECYDNAKSNIQSGLDYTKQEAFSTHIQDIAVRNVLARLGKKFLGTNCELLQIRSKDSAGFKYGPGNIPFMNPELIHQPSKCPGWANVGSVEDFWQSNKWVQFKRWK